MKVSANERFWDSEDQTDLSSSPTIKKSICVEVALACPESVQFKVVRPTLDEYRMTTECLDEVRITASINLCESDTEMECDGRDDEVPMIGGSEDEAATDASMFYHEFETGTKEDAVNSTQACHHRLDSGYLTQASVWDHRSSPNRSSRDELEAPREFIMDMEPIDKEQLEYSYRPSDLIENFYSGPTYWKFLKPPRPRTTSTPRGKRCRAKVTLKTLKNFDYEQAIIQKDDLAKKIVIKEWSRGVLKLPQDFQLQLDILQGFNHSCLSFDDPFIDVAQDEDFQDDEAYYDDSFTTMVPEPTSDRFPMPVTPRNTTNRAANIRSIKEMSMLVIVNEACVSQSSAVRFSSVYSKVDKMLNQDAEKSSCALTFLSLLHAAAEKNIELKAEGTIDDFTIILKP